MDEEDVLKVVVIAAGIKSKIINHEKRRKWTKLWLLRHQTKTEGLYSC